MNYYNNVFVYDNRQEATNAYYKRVHNHQLNIRKAFSKYGKKLSEYLNLNYDELELLISKHDNSKISNQEEIRGNVAHFYPYKDDGVPLVNFGQRRSIYEKGLLSHYHNNPHHPEYWVVIKNNTLTAMPMEKIYLAEMILDWIANQSDGRLPIKDYWKINRSKKFFHADTVKMIDDVIELIEDSDEDLELIDSK